MLRGLIGKKIGMTQIFDKTGSIVPVTVLQVGPCKVLEVKEAPKKVKIGFDPAVEARLSKATSGYFRKLNIEPLKTVREFDSTDNSIYQVGQELKADFFKAGDFVDVTGISIGKGFQGGMKRWHWRGGGASHGSNHKRRVGSIGSSTFPGRTIRGKTMPGHMGMDQVTVQNLRVMEVILDDNVVLIKGAVPGAVRSTLVICKAKKRVFRSLDEQRVVVKHKVNPMKQSKAAAKGK